MSPVNIEQLYNNHHNVVGDPRWSIHTNCEVVNRVEAFPSPLPFICVVQRRENREGGKEGKIPEVSIQSLKSIIRWLQSLVLWKT